MKLCTTLILTAAVAGVLLTGCNRNNEEIEPESMVSAEDNARTENEMASVYDFVENEAQAEPDMGGRANGTSGNLPGCATRTYNAATKTLTIDFGSTNCLCNDGLYRRGQIVAVFTGKYRTPGSNVVITLQNYFVNDNQHTGTKTITYQGNSIYQVQVQNASIITSNGTITWNSQRQLQRLAGDTTLTPFDDVYLVTGSANGVNRRGMEFTVTIDQPLKRIFQLGCARNFVAGILTITNSNGKSMKLNYDPIGGEPCDKIAEVSANGKTKRISLR